MAYQKNINVKSGMLKVEDNFFESILFDWCFQFNKSIMLTIPSIVVQPSCVEYYLMTENRQFLKKLNYQKYNRKLFQKLQKKLLYYYVKDL